MNKHIIHILILPLALLLSSCFEPDDLVEPHSSGDVESGQVEMTSTYKYQVYYDLGTASVVGSNHKNDWDLGFAATDTGTHVILNTGNYMWVAKTGLQDLFAAVDTSTVTWKFDDSSLGVLGTAIGAWGSGDAQSMTGNGELLLINLGYDEIGLSRGIMRLVIDKLESDTFHIRFAEFTGTTEYSARIPKDGPGNHVCFSFDNGGQVKSIEPDRDAWDLHFTQYTTILLTNDGDPYPYLVTGVLINPNHVQAVMDSTIDFESIDLAKAQQYQLSKKQDVIGYEWKWFDFDATTYLVLPQNIYIIRDTEDYLYKLRFVSFIDEFGERGFPGFEFVRL